MAKDIDSAFDAILGKCMSITKRAVRSAAKKAHKDIIKESYRQLAKYYASYKPKKYKRTKRLHKAIIPIFKDNSTQKEILFEIGVEYDANKLKGFYYSNSWYHQSGTEWIGRNDPYFDWDSSNNGIPEPEWIMDNFLKGRHIWGDPDTFGPSTSGKHSWGQIDAESPGNLMEEFFDTTLPEYINSYISKAMTDRLIKELNKVG